MMPEKMNISEMHWNVRIANEVILVIAALQDIIEVEQGPIGLLEVVARLVKCNAPTTGGLSVMEITLLVSVASKKNKWY